MMTNNHGGPIARQRYAIFVQTEDGQVVPLPERYDTPRQAKEAWGMAYMRGVAGRRLLYVELVPDPQPGSRLCTRCERHMAPEPLNLCRDCYVQVKSGPIADEWDRAAAAVWNGGEQ